MPTHHSTTLAGNNTISRSLKYSCSGACLAVILLLGSYRSIFCQQTEIGQLNALKLFDGTVTVINRNPFDLEREGPNQQVQNLGRFVARSRNEGANMACVYHTCQTVLVSNKSDSIIYAKSWNLNILDSSSISESPGNKGFWFTISAKIQPTDHTSTGVEYCLAPRRISGALYHNVTT